MCFEGRSHLLPRGGNSEATVILLTNHTAKKIQDPLVRPYMILELPTSGLLMNGTATTILPLTVFGLTIHGSISTMTKLHRVSTKTLSMSVRSTVSIIASSPSKLPVVMVACSSPTMSCKCLHNWCAFRLLDLFQL